ncbi:MAG TPA: metal-dependent transcriptional regulator [bacterium]|nr:metal-dependent transcriptional regulator [bacterium]
MRNLTSSQEDYLEAIYVIASEKEDVCVRDIADRLSVAMPSVTGAMRRLAAMGLVRHGRYEYVELTAEGRRRAAVIADRHALLKRFLTEALDVDDEIAEEDACAIEHHVSDATVEAMIRLLNSEGRGDA